MSHIIILLRVVIQAEFLIKILIFDSQYFEPGVFQGILSRTTAECPQAGVRFPASRQGRRDRGCFRSAAVGFIFIILPPFVFAPRFMSYLVLVAPFLAQASRQVPRSKHSKLLLEKSVIQRREVQVCACVCLQL